MKAIVILGLASIILCGCKPKPQEAIKKEPIHWEYQAFEYDRNKESLGGKHLENYITFMGEMNIKTGDYEWSQPETLYGVDDALNHIGEYGWELAWTDGTNFIVKRPEERGGRFVISSGYK